MLEIELDYTCGDGEELVTVIERICELGGAIKGIRRPRNQWPRLIVIAPRNKMRRLLDEYCGGDREQVDYLLREHAARLAE